MKWYKSKGLSSGGDKTAAEPISCLPYPENMIDAMTCPKKCDDDSDLDLLYGNIMKQ